MTKKALNQLRRKLRLYWHIHHEEILEQATEPLKNRIEYIKRHKPKGERQTRLSCLKPVKRPDLLPPCIIKQAVLHRDARSYPVDVRKGHCLPWDNEPLTLWNGRKTTNATFNKIMARHRKEYPKCTCDKMGHLVFS